MADKVFDGTDRVRQLFRAGQSVTDEAGEALSSRVVKTLNVIRFPGGLRDGLLLCRGNDPGVDRSLSGREHRLLTVHRRQIRPQLLRTLMTVISDIAGNDWPCLFVHGDPHPLLVGLFLYE